MYSHTIVTNSPKPPYHSINFGASPRDDITEINWKSNSKLNAATAHTTMLIPMDSGEEETKYEMFPPKSENIHEPKYIMAIANVADITAVAKPRVTLIIPVL